MQFAEVEEGLFSGVEVGRHPLGRQVHPVEGGLQLVDGVVVGRKGEGLAGTLSINPYFC